MSADDAGAGQGARDGAREDAGDDAAADATGDTVMAERPPLVVVRGNATDEEVAALVAVLQARAVAAAQAAAAASDSRPRSRWAAPERKLRVTLPHGPGGWAASALPR